MSRMPRGVIEIWIGDILLLFVSWTIIQSVALYLWHTASCCIQLITQVEIHDPKLYLGYDVLLVTLLGSALLFWRGTRNDWMTAIINGVAAILAALGLGIGMIYYGAGFLRRYVWSPSGTNWYIKGAAVYAACVVAALLFALALTIIKRSLHGNSSTE